MFKGKTTLQLAALLVLLSCNLTVVAAAGEFNNDFQRNTMFQPNASQLEREAMGFIFIYDGLADYEIDRAMDEYPERIDSMMFVRTRLTDASGNPLRDPLTGDAIVSDDGCED